MNPRKRLLNALQAFHEDFKVNNFCDSSEVENSINSLPETDKNFILVTRNVKDIAEIYPVSKTLSGRLTLGDILMAYHLYLKEKNNVGNKDDVIAEADRFYKVI